MSFGSPVTGFVASAPASTGDSLELEGGGGVNAGGVASDGVSSDGGAALSAGATDEHATPTRRSERRSAREVIRGRWSSTGPDPRYFFGFGGSTGWVGSKRKPRGSSGRPMA